MDEDMNGFLKSLEKESHGKWQAMERLLSAADHSKVFGQPVTSGEYTVITAAEVAGGGGFGSGMGFGPPRGRRGEASDELGPSAGQTSAGAGMGVGGGGGSIGRPVAVVIAGPEGVRVKPVFDLTKCGLAALTAFAAVGVVALKTLKKRRPR